MKEIKVAMLGLGSVNKNLLTILNQKRDQLAEQYGLSFNVIVVSDSSGYARDDEGFDMMALVDHKNSGKRVSDLSCFRKTEFELDGVDVVFEATPVDVKTGGEALKICREALNKGISVVLANKGPVVHACSELNQLAKDNRCGFLYSATVCGGLPVLNIGRRDMIAGNISKLCGVFNGTSNFIFDAMLNGMDFGKAVIEAQEVGAAEADPSLDTGGWDTAFKLLIIANTIMNANLTLDDINVKGIEDITAEMLSAEHAVGNTIKLLASAENGRFTVEPAVLKRNSFLGSCNGWEMGVEIHSDLYGIMYHKLYEKEPIPTAASMMRDAVNIFSNKNKVQ